MEQQRIDEIVKRGEEIYRQTLQERVEADKTNVGKVLVLDVDSGDYEIDDVGLSAAHRLRARRPEAVLYALRIGYDAMYALGGIGRDPLLGMALLDGCDLHIEVTDGGLVAIDTL
jgi:hypothetical protein